MSRLDDVRHHLLGPGHAFMTEFLNEREQRDDTDSIVTVIYDTAGRHGGAAAVLPGVLRALQTFVMAQAMEWNITAPEAWAKYCEFVSAVANQEEEN